MWISNIKLLSKKPNNFSKLKEIYLYRLIWSLPQFTHIKINVKNWLYSPQKNYLFYLICKKPNVNTFISFISKYYNKKNQIIHKWNEIMTYGINFFFISFTFKNYIFNNKSKNMSDLSNLLSLLIINFNKNHRENLTYFIK